MKSPLQLLQSLLADVKRFDPSLSGLDRDYLTIKRRYEHEGIGFLTISLSAFGQAFDRALASRHFGPVLGFRRKPKTSLPNLFWGLTSEVFESTTGRLKESPSVSCIKSIRQLCRFFKKSLIEDNEDKLHASALEDFYGKDKKISGYLPEYFTCTLRRVSSYILSDLFQKKDFFGLMRHGPGAVFEGKKGNQKWSLLSDYIQNGYDLFPESELDLLHFSDPVPLKTVSEPSDRSRFVSVPKSNTSRRGITVEPLMNQFYQQALNTLLRSSIAKCKILKRCIDLTDQAPNQKLALAGSRTGEWATLDLSSASDLLSKDLVREVFYHQSWFFESADRCRSLFEDGSPMNKFAGMGNATTFPVQSVVFAVIAICAILRKEALLPNKRNCIRVARLVRVFGDDIIVPTKHSSEVITWIQDCGLRVNTDKSFTEGKFRESCGVDAYAGVDVTPVYYKLDPRVSSWSHAQIETMVSTSNQLWLNGYYSTATLIADAVEHDFGNLPIVLRESGAIGWHTRKRVLYRTRYNKDLQRNEVKLPISIVKRIKDPLDGVAALYKFFLTSLLERDKGHLERVPVRYSNRIKARWLPVTPVKSTYLP